MHCFAFCTLLCVTLVSVVMLGYVWLPFLERWCVPGTRAHTPEQHAQKVYVPSCGGFIFLPTILILALGCGYYLHIDVAPLGWISLITLMFAGIGLYDDIYKLWYRTGISEQRKFMLQSGAAGVFAIWWYFQLDTSITWATPIGAFHVPVGTWLFAWIVLLIVGVSNAVNLTDGIDGLASHAMLWYAATFMGCLLLGHYDSMLAIYLSVIIGGMLGFIWHNAYPARIFMGDIGSLPLGALSAVLAIMAGLEWMLPLLLCVPFAETISVIIQVACNKLFGWRPFALAPIHHHFEKRGWHEATIVNRAMIISITSGIIAIMILAA